MNEYFKRIQNREQLIVWSNYTNSELEQIFAELKFALKKIASEEDLIKFTLSVLKESGKTTLLSKKDTATFVFGKLKKLTTKSLAIAKNKVAEYQNNGIENEFKKDADNLKYRIKNLPDDVVQLGMNLKEKALQLNEEFLKKTKDEKIELLAVSVMGILIFYASAGGNDLEGGIPDSDLNFGIGNHRNVVSHSIIAGLIVELLMRSGLEWLNKIHENLPETHHRFWDKSNQFLNINKGIALGAMWAGVGAHLLKDSGIFGYGVKAYVGIPVGLSMVTHQAIFAANGAVASAIAIDELNKSRNEN